MAAQKCGTFDIFKYSAPVWYLAPHFEALFGRKTSSTLDGDKFTDFWDDLMKILFFGKIWYFHGMDFLDGVKGQNSKNICINVTFSHTICEK